MLEYLSLFVICITIFSRTNSYQFNKWRNCSRVLCPSRQSECVLLDQHAVCGNHMSLMFKNISEEPVYLNYLDYTGDFVINAYNEAEITFDNTRYFWDKLHVVKVVVLSITRFCGFKHNINRWKSEEYTCTVTDPRFYSLNLNYFSVMNSTTTLNLISNCLRDLTGNINEKFPKLEKLNLEINFLSVVPPGLRNMTKLNHLVLRKNIINQVKSDDFNHNTFLTNLDLGQNCIQHLPNDLFRSLEYLETLSIDNNQLDEIPEDLLSENKRLVLFAADHNKLRKIPKELFRHTTQLKKVYLNNNHIFTLPEELFFYTEQLSEVYLDNNQLFTLPITLFTSAGNLKTVILNSNNFTELPTLRLSSSFVNDVPPSFDFSYNFITKFNESIVNKIPTAKTLTLSHNCLQVMPEDIEAGSLFSSNNSRFIEKVICHKCCIDKFYPEVFRGVYDKLDLSYNNFKQLNMNDLTSFAKFRDVDLSNNNISLIDIAKGYPLVKNKTENNVVLKLNLAGNPFDCTCVNMLLMTFVKNKFVNVRPLNNDEELTSLTFNVSDVYCHEPPPLKNRLIFELKIEEFTCTETESCPQNCKCENDPHNLETNIDCSNLNLFKFPYTYPEKVLSLTYNFTNNRLNSLPPKNHPIWYKIVELNLKHNEISSLKNLTIRSVLTSINLQYNNLTHFEPELIELLKITNRRIKITLSGNPWVCNCDLKHAVNVIYGNKLDLVDDVKDLKCNFNGNHYRFIDDHIFCTSKELISNVALMSSLIPFVIVVIILSFLTVFYFRFKAEIKYFLFTRGFCLCLVTEEDVDADKEYDAFVSYSGLDGEWVNNFLIPGLENEHPNYKLCVHERDWRGGSLIVDQIVQSVKKSRRTIIVLTENFLESDWSKVEFSVAFQQAMEDNVSRVIVVVPNEVPDLNKCDEEFRSFVKLTTYVEADKPHFWRKLRCSMPRTRNLLNYGKNEVDTPI